MIGREESAERARALKRAPRGVGAAPAGPQAPCRALVELHRKMNYPTGIAPPPLPLPPPLEHTGLTPGAAALGRTLCRSAPGCCCSCHSAPSTTYSLLPIVSGGVAPNGPLWTGTGHSDSFGRQRATLGLDSDWGSGWTGGTGSTCVHLHMVSTSLGGRLGCLDLPGPSLSVWARLESSSPLLRAGCCAAAGSDKRTRLNCFRNRQPLPVCLPQHDGWLLCPPTNGFPSPRAGRPETGNRWKWSQSGQRGGSSDDVDAGPGGAERRKADGMDGVRRHRGTSGHRATGQSSTARSSTGKSSTRWSSTGQSSTTESSTHSMTLSSAESST